MIHPRRARSLLSHDIRALSRLILQKMPEEAEACMSDFLFSSSSRAPLADGSLKIGSALLLPFLLPDQRRPAAAKEETHHVDVEQTCEGYFKPDKKTRL